jgi:subtilisin family serine protease
MRKSLPALLTASTLVLSLGVATAYAQASSSALVAEDTSNLWFVELSSPPTADGTSLATVRNEKNAFRRAAAAAGITYKELRSFDTLFNGLSIEISTADRLKMTRLSNVKAMYPVEEVRAPTPEQVAGAAPDLANAIQMTGAKIAQDSRGLTGAGVKVGIIDSGIDIDHPAFGGNGSPNSTTFPTARVAFGYDFVGDAYAFPGTPVPDPNPDDCGGHGTHVAGIVGGNGGGIKGVAPGVTFGAYRVFGCGGSTSSDNILAALERAYADGMNVINQSLGAARQWPQYPTAQATSRLVNKGIVMVASIGNNGPGGSSPDGLFAAGAPGVGEKVIGVASFDNTASTQLVFTVTPGGESIGYNRATASPPSPTSGSLPMARTGTTTTTNDACSALPAGSLAGQAVLIRRGTCSFNIKSINAQNAGAAAVIIYNNVAGPAQSITVAGPPNVTIPVVSITNVDGALLDGKIAAGATTLTWTTQTISTPVATGGLISGFSSFGLAADLSLKPNIGAPGGLIYSSYPLELGAYATLSGTSMSSPHVAGAVALILEAKPKTPSNGMMTRLQNSADPKNWSLAPSLGLLDHTHRQGAGMLDIIGVLDATTVVEPSQISAGESQTGPKTTTVTVKNESGSPVTYDLSHVAAVATGPNNTSATSNVTYAPTNYFDAPATVTFSAPSVTVPAKSSATFTVTIDADATLPERSIYGGYVVLTPQGGGAIYRVPFAGLKGDYQSTVILTPTASGFPWLAKTTNGTSFSNNGVAGVPYTMVGFDIPYFAIHLDHHARRVRLEAFDAVTMKPWNRISDDEYVGRNSSTNGFFAFAWDGTTFTGKGKNASQQFTVPNGQYIVKLSVLKPLGDENNPADWETWTSPVVTIARP